MGFVCGKDEVFSCFLPGPNELTNKYFYLDTGIGNFRYLRSSWKEGSWDFTHGKGMYKSY